VRILTAPRQEIPFATLKSAKALDLQPNFGSLRWLVERYKRSRAWEKVSPRSRTEYERAFRLVLEHRTKTGTELGRLPVSTISARAADKLYLSLQRGDRVVRRLRQANVCMIRMARAFGRWVFNRGRTMPVRTGAMS
jgi:hypothetical protein